MFQTVHARLCGRSVYIGRAYIGAMVTKPMFEFEFEGELLAFNVNGDRFELLALLPRRNPRTEREYCSRHFPP